MPSTFQALVIAVFAILPGAFYTWAFEREAGAWGIGFSDRLVRFLGASAGFGVLALPLLYQAYRELVVSGSIEQGRALAWWVWTVPPMLALLPAVAGYLVGKGAAGGVRWVRPIVGPAPFPRGWDQLFQHPNLVGYVRLRLKDETWMVGYWASESDHNQLPGSYAAGFPHAQDLYFVDTCELTAEGLPKMDAVGVPVRTGVAALVNWDQVAYAEFIQVAPAV